MKRSDDRILTTHVGSLPRNPTLRDLLIRQERGEAIDEAALDRETDQAVRAAVTRQLTAGVDVGNDGEQPRVGFSTYVARRMRGFGGESRRPAASDLIEFPDYAKMLDDRRRNAARIMNAPQAVAEIAYTDLTEARKECDLFDRALAAESRRFVEPFMTAVTPGTASAILLNAHYRTHADYVMALAREMQKEYELIHSRGFVLQLDAPDLAMERTRLFRDESLDGFQRIVETHVEAINRAVVNIPPDRVRLHVCWGNYDGPHVHDVPLEAILPILCRAKVGGLSIEMANPRHQHEYKVIKRLGLPDSMVFLPGVIDSTTNFVEHPEVVADRIAQAVDAIGDRSRVIASVDCGFGTFAGTDIVAESVVWAKLGALAEGARIASKRLWGK